MTNKQLQQALELRKKIDECETLMRCFYFKDPNGTSVGKHPKVWIGIYESSEKSSMYCLPPSVSVGLRDSVFLALEKEKKRLEEAFAQL